jgi:hypothetical protein
MPGGVTVSKPMTVLRSTSAVDAGPERGRPLLATDYYPLLARAAGALDLNTVEARRVLYARARIAQAGELRKLNPPLAEQEIALERLALEDAIRKLEAES